MSPTANAETIDELLDTFMQKIVNVKNSVDHTETRTPLSQSKTPWRNTMMFSGGNLNINFTMLSIQTRAAQYLEKM